MGIDIDWNEAWKQKQAERRHADDSSYWDTRAPSFAKTAGTSPYARTFLERANSEPGSSVFDMGCGSGTLALPLAKQGIEVWACDFSQAMLDLMMQRAELDGTSKLIHPVKLAWDEDWSARDLPTCDYAFASRSMATADMRASIEKLDARARTRVCITLGTDSSPRSDETLLRVVGRPHDPYPDFVFGMNILWQMGKMPSLSYIRSKRPSEFDSPEHAVEKTCEIIEATSEERTLLEAYTREHLVRATNTEGKTVWCYDHVRVTSWAFISWGKSGE